MPIKNTPGCECCECSIFDVEDMLDSANELIEVDSPWHVVRSLLQDDGHYYVTLPVIDGDHAFALIDTNGDEFARFERTGDAYEITWNDGATTVSSLIEPNVTTMRLAVRPAGAFIELLSEEISGADFNGETVPLPLADGDLESAGALRLAIDTSDFGPSDTVAVKADRMYVEPSPVACSPYESPTLSTEENPTCDDVTACPVTWPTYTTPRFELVSVSVPGTFGHTFRSYEACESISQRTNDAHFLASYTGPSLDELLGKAKFEINDQEAPTTYARYTGSVSNDFADIDNYAFDVTSFDYGQDVLSLRADVEVVATANPCEFEVQCDLSILGARGEESPDGFITLATAHASLADDPGRIIPFYELVNSRTAAGFGTIQYAKIVNAWDGTPPTLNFTSADLVDPADASIAGKLTRSASFQNFRVDYVGGFPRLLMDKYLTLYSQSIGAITFTIQADSSNRLPHP